MFNCKKIIFTSLLIIFSFLFCNFCCAETIQIDENVVPAGILNKNKLHVIKDKKYKESLLKSMGHDTVSIARLDSIVGEEELSEIVDKYREFPEAYMIDEKEKGDRIIFDSLRHRANLHCHTTSSDGSMSVQELLDQAAEYADKVREKFPHEEYPYLVAITDHNTTEGDKIALEILYNNPEKYRNIKVVLGMEIWSYIKETPSQKNQNGIHMLAWCINPYDELYKKLFTGEYNEYEFNVTIDMIQNQEYGYIGIAHPVREIMDENIADGKTIFDWIKDTFDMYILKNKGKMMFTEVYYQRYRFDKDEAILEAVKQEAEKRGIKPTGGLDTHTDRIYLY